MANIRTNFNPLLAKKILSNKENALSYLSLLNNDKSNDEINKITKNSSSIEIWDIVTKYWDYEKSTRIIRQLFKETEKYKRGIKSANLIDKLISEWSNLNLGKVEWPCSQGEFDNFVQRINSLNADGLKKIKW